RAETLRAARHRVEIRELDPRVEVRRPVEIAETRDEIVFMPAKIALEHELHVGAPARLVAAALVVDGLVGEDARSRHLLREVLDVELVAAEAVEIALERIGV